jgi:hypothetical protein
MKYRLILSTTLTCALFSSMSYGFFCPKNFNVINFGDTLATVQQQCGSPDSKLVTDAPDNEPQEWNYFLSQPSSVGIASAAQGTLKTSMAFDGNGKLINISVNGIGVASINNCGSAISLGDTRDKVEAACGKSSFITKQSQSNNANASKDDESNKAVELTYNSTPPVTLVFVAGKLAAKK